MYFILRSSKIAIFVALKFSIVLALFRMYECASILIGNPWLSQMWGLLKRNFPFRRTIILTKAGDLYWPGQTSMGYLKLYQEVAV